MKTRYTADERAAHELRKRSQERDLNNKPIKAHLRVVGIGHNTYHVVSLRPQEKVRFSTNYFHDTWHILSDGGGARVLARMLWALSFARTPGTVFVLGDEHLVPTPFEADPPSPILLAHHGLASLSRDDVAALHARLRRGVPIDRTVKLQTFGLVDAIESLESSLARRDFRRTAPEPIAEQMGRRGAFVCYTAVASRLRTAAIQVYRMHDTCDVDYLMLGGTCGGPFQAPGEVQIFRDFTQRVSAATVARREVMGEQPLLTDVQRTAVYGVQERAFARLLRAQKPRRGA